MTQQQQNTPSQLANVWANFEEARERCRQVRTQPAVEQFTAIRQHLTEQGVRVSAVSQVEERREDERFARLLYLKLTVHIGLAKLDLDTRLLEGQPESDHWSSLAKNLKDCSNQLLCNQ